MEKAPPPPAQHPTKPTDPMPRRRESILKTILLALLFAIGYVTWSLLNPWTPRLSAPSDGGLDGLHAMGPSQTQVAVAKGKRLVPLEAHIMSKCPDARDCLRQLVLPVMQIVEDKVDFKLSFIGTPHGHDDSVECKHGPSECLGNMLELCAARLYPDPKIYLGFVMCVSRQYQKIPEKELIQDCALEHAIDFERLNGCVSDETGGGMNLLRDSVQRSINAGVQYSCTVRLSSEIRCIMDGGEWKDCPGGSSVQALVADVEKAYKALNG